MPYKKIVVAVDFSECSSRAFDYALALARTLGASIEALHVTDAPPLLPLDMPLAGDAITDYRRRTAARMKEFVARHGDGSGVSIRTRIESGVAQDVITVASEAADLVVIGTHGRSGWSHVLMGSVAEKTVRTSKCPVVTVPLRASRVDA